MDHNRFLQEDTYASMNVEQTNYNYHILLACAGKTCRRSMSDNIHV